VPEILRPNIAFWKRIFGVLDTQSGVLHDTDQVSIIYHTFSNLPESPQERQDVVETHKERYRRILETLAAGKRSNLGSDEERVLALFKGKPAAILQAAADNMHFQQGIRDRFAEGLLRSLEYLPEMERIFADEGLPRELVLLPHVESSFNRRAYSRAGAAGLWQFTAGTGRRFLRIDRRVDERLDVRQSTIAAAKLLRENYELLGTWPLAITAYNHGANGMRQAVETVGSEDFGVIVERYSGPLFGFASKNFYAEFLAAIEVVKQHRQYFPELTFARSPYVRMADSNEPRRETAPVQTAATAPQPHREYHVQPGDTLWSIAQHFDTTPLTLAALNGFSPREEIKTGQVLTLPAAWPQEVARASSPPRETAKPVTRVAAAAPARPSATQRVAAKTYQVRSGDTLTQIAQRFGTTVPALIALNELKQPVLVKTGQVLTLPAAAAPQVVARNTPAKAPNVMVQPSAANPPGVSPVLRRVAVKTYRVRPGDTLTQIAQRFGTTVPALIALNGLKHPVIKPGQVLTLPATAPRTVAERHLPPETAELAVTIRRLTMAG
jgi:membrane-bound lytic murein transglycosylase D